MEKNRRQVLSSKDLNNTEKDNSAEEEEMEEVTSAPSFRSLLKVVESTPFSAVFIAGLQKHLFTPKKGTLEKLLAVLGGTSGQCKPLLQGLTRT